jgi:hypothetical protein
MRPMRPNPLMPTLMAMIALSSFKFQMRERWTARGQQAQMVQCDCNTFNTVSATLRGVKPKCSNNTGAGALSP